MTTISFRAIEFETAHEAIQWAEVEGDRAILLDGRRFVVEQEEANRLAEAGVAFAYLFDRELRSGEHRIVTVPIN